jgi:hypothetical protein
MDAAPVIASGGNAFAKVSNMLTASSGIVRNSSDQQTIRQQMEDGYGLSREFQIQVENTIRKSMFGENTAGADREALLCLKKGPSGLWLHCENYEQFVKDLVERRRQAVPQDEDHGERPKLKVTAYFGESDLLIGKRGQIYVEDCWTGKEAGDFEDVLDFQTTTVGGADHDSVYLNTNIMERVFADAGGSLTAVASADVVGSAPG